MRKTAWYKISLEPDFGYGDSTKQAFLNQYGDRYALPGATILPLWIITPPVDPIDDRRGRQFHACTKGGAGRGNGDLRSEEWRGRETVPQVRRIL